MHDDCGCLDDTWTCACCGSLVETQDVDGELRTMHFVDHEYSEEDEAVHSVWDLHDKETCMEMRKEHWIRLVRGGICVESV